MAETDVLPGKENSPDDNNELPPEDLEEGEEIILDKRFPCKFCKMVYYDRALLKEHQFVHVRKPYNCGLCSMSFSTVHALTIHLKVHTEESTDDNDEEGELIVPDLVPSEDDSEDLKPYSCQICMTSFVTEDLFNHHQLMIHTVDEYCCCDSCSSIRVETPESTLTEMDSYLCGVCNISFTQPNELREHLLTHNNNGIKPFACDTCNRSFTNAYSLKLHQSVHEDSKPYNCLICNKGCKGLPALKQHLKVHGDDKPFQCEMCEKAFFSIGHLQRHQRVHMSSAFSCVICGKTFADQRSMRMHFLSHTEADDSSST